MSTQGTTSSGQNSQSELSGAIAEINQEFKEKEVHQHARELGMPYIDIYNTPINDDLLRLIPEEKSKEAQLIAFFLVGKKLRVAVIDPNNEETKNLLEYLEEKNFILNINICSSYGLEMAQKNYSRIKKKNTDVKTLEAQMLSEDENIAQGIRKLADIPEKFEEIQSDLALAILHRKAINLRASDIHFEPTKKGIRVRGRIDGLLQDFFILSNSIAKGIIRQIKFSANIKSNTSGIPADGQMKFSAGKKDIMVRVSTLPEKKGESIVMRYLDPSSQKKDISSMGFSKSEQKKLKIFLQMKQGLILVTGPTGSGKTTTLYSMLSSINTPEKKIITLEDPVEYEMEGLVQSSINEEKGYTFSSGLKSCLRQDPDILLIGEIRDLPTAESALQASLTGHFVMSTLHTNSALETIIRLRDIGVENYLVASSLKGIIAQRLVRQPCQHCLSFVSFTAEQKKFLLNTLRPAVQRGDPLPKLQEKMTVGKGCKHCGKTGYKGRTVISETIICSAEFSNAIAEGKNIATLKEILKNEHQKFFSFDAAVKILQGKTDWNEAIRVLGSNFTT